MCLVVIASFSLKQEEMGEFQGGKNDKINILFQKSPGNFSEEYGNLSFFKGTNNFYLYCLSYMINMSTGVFTNNRTIFPSGFKTTDVCGFML